MAADGTQKKKNLTSDEKKGTRPRARKHFEQKETFPTTQPKRQVT